MRRYGDGNTGKFSVAALKKKNKEKKGKKKKDFSQKDQDHTIQPNPINTVFLRTQILYN